MKKPLVVTLLTSAILIGAAPAIGAPPYVSVNGGGTIADDTNPDGGTVHVTISARRIAEAPNAEASGNVTIKFPGEPAVHGTVDCLDVDPSELAGLTGQLDNGLFFNITLTDGDQEGVPDGARLRELSTDPLRGCRTRGDEPEIINGNFQVRFPL